MKQKREQANLAASIYACKLISKALNAWKFYTTQTARLREVDYRARNVALKFMADAT
jgi:hypothetical protein